MATTQILLVRHGQSTWNAQGRWQGRADPPLSPLGQQQAAEAASRIGVVDAVLASPLVRARQTAEIIASHIGVGPVATDERLVETDAGDWTGLTFQEIRTGWPGWLDGNRFPDNFEQHESIARRMTGVVLDLAATFPGGTLVVVSHGGAIRNLDRAIGDDSQPVPNLGSRWYHVDNDNIVGGERLHLVKNVTHSSSAQV